MGTKKMTWRPAICKIVKYNILPRESNDDATKSEMIQEHNNPETNQQQNIKTGTYIRILREN